jgi:repressor LexA
MAIMHAQTRRQREVLDFITRYIDSHGYRPSYQVVARHMGVSSRAGIARIVHELESQGLLTRRRENGHFYIDVGKGGSRQANSIGEGVIEWLDIPMSSEQEPNPDPFVLPDFMLAGYEPSRMRAFRVTDNAMSNENICRDDVALIELREFARYGQTVVAVLDDRDTVLRKYFRENADIELRSSDSDADAIRLTADRVEIKGVYRGLLRPLD